MKMIKKIVCMVLFSTVMLSMANITAFSAGSRLPSLFFTKMAMQKGPNKMNELPKLSDNAYGDTSAVAFAKTASDPFTENDYLDMYMTKMSVVESITFGIRGSESTLTNQKISSVRIDYFDEVNGNYVTAVDNYTLDYVLNTHYLATVTFSSAITTTRFRIYPLSAPRTWNNYRIDELYATGTVTTGKMNNANLLYNPVTITTTSTISPDSGLWQMNTQLNDGTIALPGLSSDLTSNPPSASNPYIVEFDFGNQLYNVTGLDMITQFPADSGVVSANFKYYDNGQWLLAKSMSFNRTVENDANQWTLKNDAYDIVNFDNSVLSNKFRLEITSAMLTWKSFRINELILKGSKYVPVNIGMGGVVTSTIQEGILSNLTDNNNDTSVMVQTPSFPETIDIFYPNAVMNLTGLSIVSDDNSPKNIDIEYLSNTGWKTIKSDEELVYTGDIAEVSFDSKVVTTKIRIKINSSNSQTLTINEVNVYGTKSAPTGTKRSGLYFTPMSLNVGAQQFNVLTKLTDGMIGDYNAVVFAKAQSADFTENDYLEIYNTSMTIVDSIYFAIRGAVSTFDNQKVSKIRLDYVNETTGLWETLLDNYEINYILNTNYEAKIVLGTSVKANRFRVYPLEAPRTWNNFRFDELYTMGTETTGKMNNGNLLYNPVTITVNSSNPSDTDLWRMRDHLNDGTIKDAGLSSNLTANPPTAENPYIIDFDFGDTYYSVDSIDMITQYPGNSGVNKGFIKYMAGNEYVTAKELNFDRNVPDDNVNHYSILNDAYDKIIFDNPIKSNKFRLEITDAILAWGNFRINELIFNGSYVSEELATNAGHGAEVYTTLKSQDDVSNLVDSNSGTSFIASEIKGNEIIELKYNNKLINFSKVRIISDDFNLAPKNIEVQAYLNGEWVSAAVATDLSYTDNKAEIILNQPAKSDRIRFIFSETEGSSLKINSINLIGFTESKADRAIGTTNYAPNGIIGTNIMSDNPASYINDGDNDTAYVSDTGFKDGSYVTFKMPGYLGLDKITAKSSSGHSNGIVSFEVRIKDENGNWVTKFDNCIFTGWVDGVSETREYILPERLTTNEFKIVITRHNGDYITLNELELIGECYGKYPNVIEIKNVERTSVAAFVDVHITNIDSKACNNIIIVGIYSKTTGELLGVNTQEAALSANEVKTFTISVPVSIGEDNIEAKAFDFNSFDEMTPVSLSATL